MAEISDAPIPQQNSVSGVQQTAKTSSPGSNEVERKYKEGESAFTHSNEEPNLCTHPAVGSRTNQSFCSHSLVSKDQWEAKPGHLPSIYQAGGKSRWLSPSLSSLVAAGPVEN
jgi:hypothetical protein